MFEGMNTIDTSGLTDYYKTVNRLVGQITDPGTIHERRLTTKNRNLSRENSRLENQNQQLQGTNNRLVSQNRSLQQNVDQLQSQVGRLDQQLSQAQRTQPAETPDSVPPPKVEKAASQPAPDVAVRPRQAPAAPAVAAASATPAQAAAISQPTSEPGTLINTFA